jgi:hypothetical protein
MKKNKKMSGGKKMAMVGMAALAGGAYYLLGPDGKKHQKKATKLVNKIKQEVRTGMAKGKELEQDWQGMNKKTKKK